MPPSGGSDPLPEAPLVAPPPPARRRRLWWLIAVLVAAAVAGGLGYQFGGKNAVRDYKAEIAASASAQAAVQQPADLFCPDPASEDARKAIKALPVVVIDRPPVNPVVIMRKSVVVVLKAELAGDLVVCGNDARLVLEKSPRASARILMQGGTDTKTKGAGPMVFLVDGVKANPQRIWFSNHNPQIVPCRGDESVVAGTMRPCTSYYTTAPPPSPTPSRTS